MAKVFAFEMYLWYVEMWGILCLQFLDVFKVLKKRGTVCKRVLAREKKLY